jgi:hypothetical protein
LRLSQERLLALRQSQVPLVVHVQDADEAMPTAKQMQLAANLTVEPIVFRGGHMEAEARERDRLSETVSNLLALGRSFAASQPAPVPFTPLQKKVRISVSLLLVSLLRWSLFSLLLPFALHLSLFLFLIPLTSRCIFAMYFAFFSFSRYEGSRCGVGARRAAKELSALPGGIRHFYSQTSLQTLRRDCVCRLLSR